MKRVDIKTGFLCNNNCLFCAQAHNKGKGNKTYDMIVDDLNQAKKNNCNGVVFTGGEVTIRKDLIKLVKYSKKIGFKHIQLQTNARMLSYMEYCEKLVKAGVTEFAPALHGSTAKIHDELTTSQGSFEETVQGIKNVRKFGLNVLSNSVVVKQNVEDLPNLADLLIKLGVSQFQMAFVHPIGHGFKNFDDVVPKVSYAEKFIKLALQKGIDAGKMVMAEAMPYCVMKGYEKYVAEQYIPDTEIRGYDYIDIDHEQTRVNEGKVKFEKCKKCFYYSKCEGPWKEYPDKFGEEEFVPVVK